MGGKWPPESVEAPGWSVRKISRPTQSLGASERDVDNRNRSSYRGRVFGPVEGQRNPVMATPFLEGLRQCVRLWTGLEGQRRHGKVESKSSYCSA